MSQGQAPHPFFTLFIVAGPFVLAVILRSLYPGRITTSLQRLALLWLLGFTILIALSWLWTPI
jgi:hypothetical protein